MNEEWLVETGPEGITALMYAPIRVMRACVCSVAVAEPHFFEDSFIGVPVGKSLSVLGTYASQYIMARQYLIELIEASEQRPIGPIIATRYFDRGHTHLVELNESVKLPRDALTVNERMQELYNRWHSVFNSRS